MSFVRLSIVALWSAPFAGALVARMTGPKVSRAAAIVVATFALILSGALFAVSGQHDYHRGLDGLSAVLLPLTAALTLAAILAAPRRDLDGRSLSRVLVAEGGLLGCLITSNLLLFAVFWLLSLAPLARSSRRITALAFLITAICLGAAIAGVGLHGASYDLVALRAAPPLPTWIGALLLVAALCRMGIVPLHLWIAQSLQHGSAPLVVTSLATPVGSFALARVVVPLFPDLSAAVGPALIALGSMTALHGALLATVQHDLRRMLGHFLISQRGMVLAGIAALNIQSVAGALLHAMSVIAAVAGLVLLAASIQARTGTTDMRRLGGLHRRTRRLSLGFLLLCAAAVGFPGSVGFVSDDLMIQGLLRGHAVAVVCMLVATALNGITLFRAFKRTFLGPPAIHADDLSAIADSLPRERWVSSTLILALLISGFAPAPLLAIRHSVVTALSPRSGGTAPPSRTGLLP